MKLPRDLSGADFAKALGRLGYQVTRQTGSHIRLTVAIPYEHHVTVPAHDPLKVGTLAAVLAQAPHLPMGATSLSTPCPQWRP